MTYMTGLDRRTEREQRAIRVRPEQEEQLPRDRLSQLSPVGRDYLRGVERALTQPTIIMDMECDARFAYFRS